MKTDELKNKEEVETVSRELQELNEEELTMVVGGVKRTEINESIEKSPRDIIEYQTLE